MRLQLRFEIVEDTGELLERYTAQQRTGDETVTVLDAARIASWHRKEAEGEYKRAILHAYLVWDPRIHHQATGKKDRKQIALNLSERKCVERTKKEHEELLAEFETLLTGVEAMMQAAELGARRLTDEEIG